MSCKPSALLFIFILLVFASCNRSKKARIQRQENAPPVLGERHPPMDAARLKSKAAALKLYAEKNQYNTHYALFIDFSVFSGSKRFVLYDLAKNKTVSMALVAHGQGKGSLLSEKVAFSNINGSRCSSLGRYKIGNKYFGQFGHAYKLYGLNSTNSNAYTRFVVLHSHACVPLGESSFGICRSDGCPTLNPDYFERLQKVLDNETSPVLLEIYN